MKNGFFEVEQADGCHVSYNRSLLGAIDAAVSHIANRGLLASNHQTKEAIKGLKQKGVYEAKIEAMDFKKWGIDNVVIKKRFFN